ncbi:MAG TPA: hypothetical protein PKA28_02555 [Methylomusa anaerophila]|uniref:Uncharacterized protein n=1 Tax=Methylomusa anaerophila TaxID=1930071 RepID=A0A348AP48_9FIRM|nr:hypothetical protein [Methylomusa anaerophila]BBB92846.1 hypothetical protein MAMMFC1_03554 [Methylomusa anaerophila]HML87315.1 hypothetical protein [Methylomusa anaerophila]
MPGGPIDKSGSPSLIHTITRLIDASITEGAGLDNLITVLSIICLISVLNRNQTMESPAPTSSAASSNPIQKLLGELTKAEGSKGGSPDLMSLLPLLNNPQIKSKLNPATMASILGMLNNMSGSASDKPDKPNKQEQAKDKAKSDHKNGSKESEAITLDSNDTANRAASAAISDSPPPAVPEPQDEGEEGENPDNESKNLGRYLNWKNNF